MPAQTPDFNDNEFDLLEKITNNTALLVDGGGGGGTGTVTSVSVITANGVSGSVANPTTAPAITLTLGNIGYATIDGTNLIGFRGVPQNSQSAPYTTVLTDAGKEIYHPVGDANARTFTIDSNANVPYPVGTVIIFTNMSASNVTIAIASDTLYFFGAGTTGSRTLAQYGTCAARKLTTTTWGISGINLT